MRKGFKILLWTGIIAVLVCSVFARMATSPTVLKNQGNVMSVAFSPDGQTLVGGSADNAVRLWDVNTGNILKTLTGHTNEVHSVAFSPDGQTLASGSWDKTVRLWDVNTGNALKTLTGHTSRVSSIAFSPDGQTLVSGSSGSSDNIVRLWDVNGNASSRRFASFDSQINSIAFGQDERVFAVASGNHIWLFDLIAKEWLRTLTGHTNEVHSVAFSPDGQTLVSGSADNTVRLWDVNTGNALKTLSEHRDAVMSVAFSPNGQMLASGGAYNDRGVRLWDVNTGNALKTLTGHTHVVTSIAFSPHEWILASGSEDWSIRLWDLTPHISITPPDDFIGVWHAESIDDDILPPEASYIWTFNKDGTWFYEITIPDETESMSGTYHLTDTLIKLNAPDEPEPLLGSWSIENETLTILAEIKLVLKREMAAETVNIPDANLRKKIEAALNKASGATITTADMAKLAGLNARGANISDLTGLESATNLTRLYLPHNNISDISTVRSLTNLRELILHNNSISNISAVSGLTNLTELNLWGNSISDISVVSGLSKLTRLWLNGNNISDISAVSGLINLTKLSLGDSISNISPLAGLTNLTGLWLGNNNISDISPLAGLTNLTDLSLSSNSISDISVVSGLSKLTRLWLDGNNISNLSPLVSNAGLGTGDTVNVKGNPLNTVSFSTHIPTLNRRGVTLHVPVAQPVTIPDANLRAKIEAALGKASGATITTADMANLNQLEAQEANIRNLTGLEHATNLTRLELYKNNISDISALSGLTKLTRLGLYKNNISNVSPLASLTSLQGLDIGDNNISDISALSRLTEMRWLSLYGNNISDISALANLTNLLGLWSWINNISDISVLSGLTNLEALALGGNSNISDLSPLAGLTNLKSLDFWNNNISDISAVSRLTNLTYLRIEGNNLSDISAVSGLTDLTKLYLQRNNISDLSPLVSNAGLGTGDEVNVTSNPLNAAAYNKHIPTLQGKGVDVRFDPQPTPTNATVSISPASIESPAVGAQLTLSLKITNGAKVAGYQATVTFDTSALHYVESANGDYLPAGAFFVPPNVSGNQVPLAAAGTVESNGAGTLATVTFEVIAVKVSTLTLSDVVLSDGAGAASRPQVANGQVVEPSHPKGDVNRDGVVNIQDLVLAARRLGQRGQNDADMNGDGVVNIQDLVLVAGAFGNTGAAPALQPQALTTLTAADVQGWLTEAEQIGLRTPAHLQGIAVLEQLLSALTPKETALLPNYPNPFNPETWIPYQLTNASDVSIIIYDVRGNVLRRLGLGYQPAGYYTNRTRAAYWDGRNDVGESVASGVYFYHLSAGDYSATRRMIIVK